MRVRLKFITDLSFSAVQTLTAQGTGIVMFLLLSRCADKTVIGSMNWALALCMMVFAIAGSGIDQVAVKKIASGEDASRITHLFFMHLLVTGVAAVFFFCFVCFFSTASQATPLLIFCASQLLLYLSLPFKQAANGFERFGTLAIMSAVANFIRVAGIIALVLAGNTQLMSIAWLYLVSAGAEWIVSAILFRKRIGVPLVFRWDMPGYRSLFRQSLPQIGVVICTAIMARFDWVLLGICGNTTSVAEYSFAYKFYELSSLPLLIAGPLLLPRIAKLYANLEVQKAGFDLARLAGTELVVSVFIFLVINTCWSPLIDAVTDDKYGKSTQYVTLVLSLGTPLLYISNLFWNIRFAQGRLRSIFSVFLVSCMVNVALDILLIPRSGAMGAAVACFASVAVQAALFARDSDLAEKRTLIRQSIVIYAIGVSALVLVKFAFDGAAVQLAGATFLFASGMLLLPQHRNRFINVFQGR